MRALYNDVLLRFGNSRTSHVIKKSVFAICEQQRQRSSWAFAQSDQCLLFAA